MTDATAFSELFPLLPAKENPKHAFVGGVSYIIHEDHRWLLPIVNSAQQWNLLPKPCTLVMFDAHKDSVDPTCLEVLSAARANLTSQQLVDICKTQLRILDDDWIKAGIELGIFGDAVVFGGWRGDDTHDVDVYEDKTTSKNHSFIKSGLPLHALGYQGELSDWARTAKYQHLWKLLGWQLGADGFDFVQGLSPIALSIDLDCFTAQWRGYNFPWPDEIFETEFLQPSTYDLTRGWTGKRFLNALIQRAGLVTFAREGECTAGPAKGRHILRSLNQYVFSDRLPSTWYSEESA